MANISYQCETQGCGKLVGDADTMYCDTCVARVERMTDCSICGRTFDPASFSGEDPVCCGSPVLVDFFRGRDLSKEALDWVYSTEAGTPEQRVIACYLKNLLISDEYSVSGTWESPRFTRWRTEDGCMVRVEFAGGLYSRLPGPVVSVEIRYEYEGLTSEQVQLALAALSHRDDG